MWQVVSGGVKVMGPQLHHSRLFTCASCSWGKSYDPIITQGRLLKPQGEKKKLI